MRLLRDITSTLLSFVEKKQGDFKQKSPFIEDIDLLDEVISVKNPSKFQRNLSNWKISDDHGCNKFHFPVGTIVEAGATLTIYCSAKGRDMRNLKYPHIFWTNKDGTNRMKNVLNDGDIDSICNVFAKLNT
jgi:hypothetical protein